MGKISCQERSSMSRENRMAVKRGGGCHDDKSVEWQRSPKMDKGRKENHTEKRRSKRRRRGFTKACWHYLRAREPKSSLMPNLEDAAAGSANTRS